MLNTNGQEKERKKEREDDKRYKGYIAWMKKKGIGLDVVVQVAICSELACNGAIDLQVKELPDTAFILEIIVNNVDQVPVVHDIQNQVG